MSDKMVLEIQFRLKDISPISILKINTVCQILLEEASQALKIQKHKCMEIDVRRCVGLWVVKCVSFCTRGRGQNTE